MIQPGTPQELSCFGIERTETGIVGTADESNPSRGQAGAAIVGSSGILFFLGQTVGDTQRNLPSDFASVDIYRRQLAPRGRLAGIVIFVPEMCRTETPLAIGIFDKFFDIAKIVGVDDVIAERGIKGTARPFHAAFTAWKADHRTIAVDRL